MMISKATMKFAASGLVIGLTMVGCTASVERPYALSGASVKAEQQASQFHARARQAAQKGLMAEALAFAERAVELSPRDVAYRMVLGDLYLKNGRFRSAETSYADVLTLDPGNDRAGLSRALSLVALGDSDGALRQLDSLSSNAMPADLGLAYALAGHPERAIALLESAARAPGADGRVRQNLALAYAFSGDWQKARVTAAQDVSPAQLDARLQQWAAMASPTSTTNRVAALLDITPTADAGQPVRLALAPAPADPVAVASVEAAPAPVEAGPAVVETPAPVEVAAADAVSEPAPVAASATAEAEVDYVAAVQSLVTTAPAAVHRAAVNLTPSPTFSSPRLEPFTQKPARSGPGRYVVQIGAFSSPASVERAWSQASRLYGFDGHQPLSTKIGIAGKGTFYRLSVAGFESRAEAAQTCGSIKAKGGTCFVRAAAGDAPVRWASRAASRV